MPKLLSSMELNGAVAEMLRKMADLVETKEAYEVEYASKVPVWTQSSTPVETEYTIRIKVREVHNREKRS